MEFFKFIEYVLKGMIMYGCFMIFERIRPVEPNQPLRHTWFNLQWYVIYSFVALSIQALGINTIVTLAQKWFNAPFINIPAPSNSFQYVLIALLYLFVIDFFYYWFHRFQHTIAFLWEQHKFHHSDKFLNVTSTRRVHWLEDPLILLFLGIPMGVIFQFNSLQIGILGFIEILWLQFIHMNLRLEFGVLSRVLVSPQYHRIHHSFKEEHLDKNYAVFFSHLRYYFW